MSVSGVWHSDEVIHLYVYGASLVAQLVKYQPAMRETGLNPWVWKDALEKGKATHSSVLAWRIPWGRKELDTTERLSLLCMYICIFFFRFFSFIAY